MDLKISRRYARLIITLQCLNNVCRKTRLNSILHWSETAPGRSERSNNSSETFFVFLRGMSRILIESHTREILSSVSNWTGPGPMRSGVRYFAESSNGQWSSFLRWGVGLPAMCLCHRFPLPTRGLAMKGEIGSYWNTWSRSRSRHTIGIIERVIPGVHQGPRTLT